jgi:hypothetical protein
MKSGADLNLLFREFERAQLPRMRYVISGVFDKHDLRCISGAHVIAAALVATEATWYHTLVKSYACARKYEQLAVAGDCDIEQMMTALSFRLMNGRVVWANVELCDRDVDFATSYGQMFASARCMSSLLCARLGMFGMRARHVIDASQVQSWGVQIKHFIEDDAVQIERAALRLDEAFSRLKNDKEVPDCFSRFWYDMDWDKQPTHRGIDAQRMLREVRTRYGWY